MKKMSVIVVLVVMILTTLLMSVHAGPPTNAEGLWRYQPFIDETRVVGGNTFLKTHENGEWTGTFVGDSTELGQVVIHASGSWSFNAIVSYVGTVDGRSGTLEMSVVGSRPDVFTDWQGRWVILSGTGDLATLRGQGTWRGPGSLGEGKWGDIYYSGNVHFEPDRDR